MFVIRDQWIPSYFSDNEMASLLKTTSRSESSKFFLEHYKDSGDTLVEFWFSFESAMDRQLYTLELFYLVREVIKSGCYHTIVESMFRDDDCSHFKFKDVLLNDQVFEVRIALFQFENFTDIV